MVLSLEVFGRWYKIYKDVAEYISKIVRPNFDLPEVQTLRFVEL